MQDDEKTKRRLEIGHVLFIDIVGYSKLVTDEQSEALQELNQVVRNTEAVREAEAAGQLIILPTGDGMSLVFTRSVEEPVECALQVSQALRAQPSLPVRMGIHSGPIHHVKDANERENIAGVGINIAQRVMDCGDAGHILLSKRFADDLAQHRRWQPYLHQLGDVKVKHGVVVSLVNLYAESIGNPAPPGCLAGVRRTAPGARARNGVSPVARGIFITAALLFAVAIASVIFAPVIMRSVDKNKATAAPQPSATASPSADAIQNIVKQRITDELQKALSAKNNTEQSQAGFCSWMANDNGQFTSLFDQQNDAGSFPVLIEGRLDNGRWEFRAIFVTKPVRGFSYYACWGYQPRKYEQYRSKLEASGYDALSQQTFEDVVGNKIHQGVWVRSDQMPAAKQLLERTIR